MSHGEAEEVELPLESVGVRLLRAREAAGMTRTQVASLTRIPERHLASIEMGNFAALPARTYAVGFSRSYAKVLGMDEAAIVNEVRAELAEQTPEPLRLGIPTFEPGDPARVPSSRLTWLAALGLLAVIVAGVVMWPSLYSPGGSLGSILPEETPEPAVAAVPVARAPAPAGPVVFTALEPDIWVKFYDGAGNQLLQKQLAQGESWTVPADQPQVLIWTGRPEALAVTIGGRAVPKLSEVQRTMKDVPVTAAALLARAAATPQPAPDGAVPAATATAPRPQAQRAAGPPRRARPAPEPVQTAAPLPAESPPPTPAGDPAPAPLAT